MSCSMLRMPQNKDILRYQYVRVDTDVLVLAVTTAQRLDIPELWVAFGTGKHFRFIPAHDVASALGADRCIALPMFHEFTGCDTVSCFGGRGKRTAWETWRSYNDVTPAFSASGIHARRH